MLRKEGEAEKSLKALEFSIFDAGLHFSIDFPARLCTLTVPFWE
jgi:hypothetical protein